MYLNDISSAADVHDFWTTHHFIEPACGAGALVYALFKKVVDIGLSFDALASVEMTVIDINKDALDFTRRELQTIETKWGISFSGIRFVCADFLSCTLPASPKKLLFFGNPPFVANPRGSKWKNTFAEFVERSLTLSGTDGQVHFILPLSLAFSRDYSALRDRIRFSGKSVALSSFDNIPDTLFPSGKPEHTNTNKANSQRCSIVTVFPSKNTKILATRMHRWSKKDRERLLTMSPDYHDVTGYTFDGQFPRPENPTVMRLLRDARAHPSFKSLLVKESKNTLFVAGVARNFIGLRDEASSGVNRLCFKNQSDLYKAVLILSSDLFLDYWRSIGDGFHVTRGNIEQFPLHPTFMAVIEGNISKGRSLWQSRELYAKIKCHPKGKTKSYDFSDEAIKNINRM